MVTRNSLLPRHSELLWGLEPRRLTETVPVGGGRFLGSRLVLRRCGLRLDLGCLPPDSLRRRWLPLHCLLASALFLGREGQWDQTVATPASGRGRGEGARGSRQGVGSRMDTGKQREQGLPCASQSDGVGRR